MFFLSTDGENTFHFAQGSFGFIRIDYDSFWEKGKMSLYDGEMGTTRSYSSHAGADDFRVWKEYFLELGYSGNMLGFIPETKWVDGSISKIERKDEIYTSVQIEESNVLLDGKVAVLSLESLDSGTSAIELKTDSKTFWLFGGGSFLIKTSGIVTTTFGGIGRPPFAQYKLPQYKDFYIRLKTLFIAGDFN
ncbi:hypothetical protein N9023_06280 [Opitutaceae bacterium]|nr:hypothetical protein [Opitutaceae bacterium]